MLWLPKFSYTQIVPPISACIDGTLVALCVTYGEKVTCGARLPRIGSRIEFTMDMPSEVMGLDHDVSIHCKGRVVRHQQSEQESMAAAVIDEYVLKA